MYQKYGFTRIANVGSAISTWSTLSWALPTFDSRSGGDEGRATPNTLGDSELESAQQKISVRSFPIVSENFFRAM